MEGKRKKISLILVMVFSSWMVFGGLTFKNERVIAAEPPPIKIAVVYSLSGALARNGNLMVQGIKAGMGWVNDNGGIKSLGGAKLVPVIGDATSTVEGAASTMERVCRDPEILMAMGSWASSLTLGSTEVTERLGIPQFSISAADRLHQRGYKWGFYVGTSNSVFSNGGFTEAVPLIGRSLGREVKTAMLIGDTQASNEYNYGEARKIFKDKGIKVVGEELWGIGTLTDATPVAQKLRALKPDMVVFQATAISEAQMVLMKRKEFGIKVPFMSGGAWGADPSFLAAGAEILEGWIFVPYLFPSKITPKDAIQRTLDQCRKEYSNEPYAAQELFGFPWSMVPIMAEILERAGSRNRQAIWEAGHKLDIHHVLATSFSLPKQGMAFRDNGRVAEKYEGFYLAQWQGGRPRVIWPDELAEAKPLKFGK